MKNRQEIETKANISHNSTAAAGSTFSMAWKHNYFDK